MPTQILIVAGALIFGLLGTVHLAYTFFTGLFSPRDAATEASMKLTHPRLTRRTTLWKAWVGFNASHSLGAILFSQRCTCCSRSRTWTGCARPPAGWCGWPRWPTWHWPFATGSARR